MASSSQHKGRKKGHSIRGVVYPFFRFDRPVFVRQSRKNDVLRMYFSGKSYGLLRNDKDRNYPKNQQMAWKGLLFFGLSRRQHRFKSGWGRHIKQRVSSNEPTRCFCFGGLFQNQRPLARSVRSPLTGFLFFWMYFSVVER